MFGGVGENSFLKVSVGLRDAGVGLTDAGIGLLEIGSAFMPCRNAVLPDGNGFLSPKNCFQVANSLSQTGTSKVALTQSLGWASEKTLAHSPAELLGNDKPLHELRDCNKPTIHRARGFYDDKCYYQRND